MSIENKTKKIQNLDITNLNLDYDKSREFISRLRCERIAPHMFFGIHGSDLDEAIEVGGYSEYHFSFEVENENGEFEPIFNEVCLMFTTEEATEYIAQTLAIISEYSKTDKISCNTTMSLKFWGERTYYKFI